MNMVKEEEKLLAHLEEIDAILLKADYNGNVAMAEWLEINEEYITQRTKVVAQLKLATMRAKVRNLKKHIDKIEKDTLEKESR